MDVTGRAQNNGILATLTELSKVEDKEKENSLDILDFSNSRIEKIISEQYENILHSYDNIKKQAGIGKKTLKKVVDMAVSFFEKEKKKQNPEEIWFIDLKDHLFFAQKKENNLVLTIRSDNTISDGLYGVVLQCVSLRNKQGIKEKEMVFKEAQNFEDLSDKKRIKAREIAQNDILTEYHMILSLYQGVPNGEILRGLPDKPIKFVYTNEKKYQRVGYLTKRGTENLSKFYGMSLDFLPNNTKLEIGADILAGLTALTEKGIVHKDIKPNNILLKFEGKKVAAHLIDLGGARKLDFVNGFMITNEKGQKKFHYGAHSPPYCSRIRCVEAIEAGERGDIKKSNQMILENEVFALGVLLWGFLSGQASPFKLDSICFPIIENLNETSLYINDVPEKIVELLKKILTCKPGEMISMAEAFKVYEEAIKEVIEKR